MASMPPSTTQPIPISASASDAKRLSPRHRDVHDNFEYSPRTKSVLDPDVSGNDQVSEGVVCPAAFLPRARQQSEIQLDVFHHPAELQSSLAVLNDPFTTSPPEQSPNDDMSRSPQVNVDIPHQSGSHVLDAARSPVLAIHHSRGPVAPDDEDRRFSQTVSESNDLSANANTPRRMSSDVASETTYVAMTPLPSYCCLSFLDRPREMSTLIQRNEDLFTLIEHSIPPEKYKELLELWKTPRETVPDEDWLLKTRSYLAMGPDEDQGGALWVRWKELVGWDPDEDEDDEDEWDYKPRDTSLYQQWNEIDKARGVSIGEDVGGTSFDSGNGLDEIKEGDEEDSEDDHVQPLVMGASRKNNGA